MLLVKDTNYIFVRMREEEGWTHTHVQAIHFWFSHFLYSLIQVPIYFIREQYFNAHFLSQTKADIFDTPFPNQWQAFGGENREIVSCKDTQESNKYYKQTKRHKPTCLKHQWLNLCCCRYTSTEAGSSENSGIGVNTQAAAPALRNSSVHPN